jgi:hypothetical protein
MISLKTNWNQARKRKRKKSNLIKIQVKTTQRKSSRSEKFQYMIKLHLIIKTTIIKINRTKMWKKEVTEL